MVDIEVIARAVVRRRDRVLVARDRGASWWFLPGGHVEPREPAEAALLREMAEEIGVAAVVGRLLGVVEHGYQAGGPRHEVNLVFEVAVPDGDVHSREEHLTFEWLALDDVATADLRPSAMRELVLGGDRRWFPWRPE